MVSASSAPVDGIRPSFGDRPISHAEWQNSTGVAGPPPGGPPTRKSFFSETDDDSRYRFASYELSKPEHSRRGRPSSPCPAVAGAKPRDDGLRVASRLPPRSRLGAVINLARGAGAVILHPLETDGVRANPALANARVTSRRARSPRSLGHLSRPPPRVLRARRSALASTEARGSRAPVRARIPHEPRSVGRRDRTPVTFVRPSSASVRPHGRTGARTHASRDECPRRRRRRPMSAAASSRSRRGPQLL